MAVVFGLSHASNEIDRSRDGNDLSWHLTVIPSDAAVGERFTDTEVAYQLSI